MSQTVINFYAFILLLTLIQAGLFSILLWWRALQEQQYADYLLAILCALLGLATLPHLLGWLGIGILWNEYTFLPWNGLELAILPTAYLFLLSRLNGNWRFTWAHWKHYSLYLLYFFYHLAIGLQGKNFAKWWWFEVNNHYNIDAIFSFCNLVLFVFYLRHFFRTYYRYQHWTAAHYSNLPPLSIEWIRNFLLAYSGYVVADIGLTLMELSIGAQYDKMGWFYLANLGLTYYISLYGFTHKPNYYLEIPLEPHSTKVTDVKENPVEKITNWSEWKTKITTHLETEKSYLNPDLRLTDLAEHFDINSNTLSLIINQCFSENFNDLVNRYRIETFLGKINQGALAQYTLLALAFESGFNSKSTFNRAFKKARGQAPSTYLKLKQVSKNYLERS